MNSSLGRHLRTTHTSWLQWLLAGMAGLSLSLFVWWPLWTGGGLVGGDTYPYFFPQKQLMAESFARRELPLWHDRTGLGYPLHAESQAGVFYPPNQILYRLLDVDRAYGLSIALHYWAAFLLAWRFARTQHVSPGSSLLAALIFVYGWFPARISLEWSIIGGVWLPAALWMTDRWWHDRTPRNAGLLTLVLAVHLLAGHFALAFISQLTCCLYALLKTLQQRDPIRRGERLIRGARGTGIVALCILLSLFVAAVQLAPTLELKTLSQREGTNAAFDPAYGHLPPLYLTQLVASWWYWHTPEMVLSRALTENSFLSISSATNQVEAHLYFGLLPFALLLLLLNPVIRARLSRPAVITWLVLMGLTTVYATGWLLPVTRHLPGFGFFMGPARYTIVTTLAAGILASLSLDAVLHWRSRFVRILSIGVVLGLTLPDVLKSSEAPVRDATLLKVSPWAFMPDSWLRQYVKARHEGDLRLLAPGPNVANLYGVSSLPQYLGLGPADYYVDEKSYRVRPEINRHDPFPSEVENDRLRDRGVTHILATEPILNPSAALRLVRAAPDAFLNRVWGRGASPVYLYEFVSPPSRVTSAPADALAEWSWIHRSPVDLSFSVILDQPADIVMKELMFPGWHVTIDGTTAPPAAQEGFERRVAVPAGRHTVRWRYQPSSFTAGAWISAGGLGICGFLVFCWRRRQKPQPSQVAE